MPNKEDGIADKRDSRVDAQHNLIGRGSFGLGQHLSFDHLPFLPIHLGEPSRRKWATGLREHLGEADAPWRSVYYSSRSGRLLILHTVHFLPSPPGRKKQVR